MLSGMYLLDAANVPSSHILFTLMVEAILSSESSVLTRATRRRMPEDSMLVSLVTANVLSSLILSTLMETCYSETSVLKRATRRHYQKMAFFIVTATKTSNLT
jgi:hypothetical protein